MITYQWQKPRRWPKPNRYICVATVNPRVQEEEAGSPRRECLICRDVLVFKHRDTSAKGAQRRGGSRKSKRHAGRRRFAGNECRSARESPSQASKRADCSSRAEMAGRGWRGSRRARRRRIQESCAVKSARSTHSRALDSARATIRGRLGGGARERQRRPRLSDREVESWAGRCASFRGSRRGRSRDRGS